MSFKPEVSTDGGRTFHQNALAFATREEAETSARDLMSRWMLVTDWRVVESDQPVNYTLKGGVLEATPKAAPAWADQAVIEYRYTGGTRWCPLGPAERMKPDFDGVYRLQGGVFPVEQASPKAAQGVPGDPDDSLLLCASDLQHSAICDNHAEMQACIRAIAERIKAFAAPQAAPGEQDDHQILAITTAYEQGVGKGHQAYNSGKEIANPYSPTYGCDLAWQYGYKEGKEQAQREAKAAPQQEAQEPGEIPESIERMATGRYKVVPSHESMFHRWAVVAGTGTQQLYLGREVECQNMARKFAGAFLDGAFYQSQIAAAPTPADQQAGEMEVFGLQWPGEDRINLSTVFDTEEEALEYIQNRCDTPGIRLLRFSSKAPMAQAAAPQPAPAPLSDEAKDAMRWRETLTHIGAAYHLGGQHFTLNTLRISDQMFLLRGSASQHFTKCIDESIARRAAIAAQGGKDAE